MKKIDKYILSKYLTTFFFCLLLFTAIVVVIDLSEKTDDFVKSKLSLGQIIAQYYVGFIPRLDAMLFPLFVFISVIYFTSKMAERSEIVAILSSGVSFRRFLFPYWIGGVFLGLLLLITNHFILPHANRIWGSFSAKYIDTNFGNVAGSTNNYYFRIDSNSYAGIRYYDTSSKTGSGFFIQQFANNKMKYNLRAENISWDTANKEWRLSQVAERFVVNDKDQIKYTYEKSVAYNFKPIDLRRDEYLKDRLPTKELNEYIRAEKLRGTEALGALMVERYNRDAIPASVVILTIIGAVLASRKVRGGSGFHLAMGVVLSVLYILFGRFAVVFATKGNFTPFLAAWIPNIVFAFLCLYLYKKAPK
jgi:lipopolysaccharide export system permease protein